MNSNKQLSQSTLNLFDAIDAEGNDKVIVLIEKQNANPNAIYFSDNGAAETPITTAIQSDRLQILNYLLNQAGADPNISLDYDGPYPIIQAIYKKDPRFFDLIIEKWEDPDLPIQDDYPLLSAVKVENVNMVKKLLQYGANPNGPDDPILKRKKLPLVQAVYLENLPIIKELLLAGADKNLKEYNTGSAQEVANIMGLDEIQELFKMSKDELANSSVYKTTNNVTIGRRDIQIPDHCFYGSVPTQKYEILENILGSGGYGTVYEGCLKNDCKYAVKIADLERMKSNYRNKQEAIRLNTEDAKHESEIAKTLWEQFKIGPEYFGYWVCDDVNIAFLITEKWDGDLASYSGDELNEDQILHLLNQVRLLHQHGYVHLDIALKNTFYKNNPFQVTLADFGLMLQNYKYSPEVMQNFIEYHADLNYGLVQDLQKQLGYENANTIMAENPKIFDYAMLYYLTRKDGKYPNAKAEIMKDLKSVIPSLQVEQNQIYNHFHKVKTSPVLKTKQWGDSSFDSSNSDNSFNMSQFKKALGVTPDRSDSLFM